MTIDKKKNQRYNKDTKSNREEQKMYNYLEAVTNDAKQAILENLKYWEFSDRDELEERANNELWIDDSVTGNGSGSYTFGRWKAEENLCHNMDELPPSA